MTHDEKVHGTRGWEPLHLTL